MDIETIRFLHELNNRFYQEHGASFARTRGAAWHGWKRCLEVLQQEGLTSASSAVQANKFAQRRNTLSVLDIASGNARFSDFLAAALPNTEINYFAVDNSVEMASGSEFQNLDVLELLIAGRGLPPTKPVDLCVSFGFMHHIPGQELRKALLDLMLTTTKPNKFIVVSFWQFLKSPELAGKAKMTHKQALEHLGSAPLYKDANELQTALDVGDYFLGWQDKAQAYRYCHSFSEDEIGELIAAVTDKAKLISHFSADGRTQNLNSYIVLQKSPD